MDPNFGSSRLDFSANSNLRPVGNRLVSTYQRFRIQENLWVPENKLALISLLNNAILTLPVPIVDVTIANPYNLQDFQNDKLSILDIRAVDRRGAIYDVEMQLSTQSGLVKRIVFYGCEVYAGQLMAGDDYSALKPVYSICLLDRWLYWLLHAHQYDAKRLGSLFP